MTSKQKAIKVQVPEGFNLQVEFTGASGQIIIGGETHNVVDGKLIPPSNLTQRVLEVGQRMRDGTVVLSIDYDKNKALFVPAQIFGGEARFNRQDDVVRSVNGDALHGHRDWRLLKYRESQTLADNWARVTEQDPEWFWCEYPARYSFSGSLFRGGESDSNEDFRLSSNPVPVVRSGPARVSLKELAPA